jgi:hypothetical protein
MATAAPKPCKRFKRMPLNDKFLKHLLGCDDCKAVVAYLCRESELYIFRSKPRS